MSGLFGGSKAIQTTTPIISSLRIQTSCYGRPVPWVFGTTRVTPNLIQYEDYTPHEHKTTQGRGGKGGGGGQESTDYTYTVALLLALCSGPINGIGKVWVDKDQTDLGKLQLDLYTGTATQTAYPYLTTTHPDRALSYRGLAYVASGAYDLGSSGTVGNHSFELHTPGAVSALVPDANPKDVLTAILTDKDQGIGLSANTMGSLTQFSDFCLANGIWVSPAYTDQKPAYEHIRNLLQIGFADCVYSDGKLKVVPYSDAAVARAEGSYTPDVAPIYALTEDDFLDAESPIKISRKSLNESYNHVQVKFTDRASDYNDGVAESKDQADIELFGLRTMSPVEFPEICDATTAQKVCDFLLHRSLNVRNEYEFRLPWKYVLVEPMDVLQLEYPRLGIDSTMVLVTEVSEDDQGTITIRAEEYPLGTNRNTLKVPPTIDGYAPNFGVDPGNATVPVMFEPPLSLTANDPQVFIAASGGANWGGAEVWVSTDNISYQRVGKMLAPSRYGVLMQPLMLGPAQDSLNTLSVFLAGKSAVLTPTSPENAQALVTACYVDGEYIAYTGAQLSAQNTYTLSGLVRGAYGSKIAAHASGAQFVRLDGAPFAYSYPAEWKDKTIWVKLVSFNSYGGGLQDLSAVAEYSHTITGSVVGAVQGLTITVEDDGVHARWGAPASVNGGDWSATELRKGADWASATALVTARATHYALGWLPVGALLVWAQHRNVVGGVSTPVSAGLTVLAPLQPTVTAVVDMTVVKLTWADCKTTQPVNHYALRRGSAWQDAAPIGTVAGLMTTLLEVNPGAHRFWVAAVDMGGNVGEPASVLVEVTSPISAILAQLNAGLTESVNEINALGESVGTITAHVDDITTKIESPSIGLEAQKASASMLALALQQAREASAALDLGQLLMLHKTDTTIRDAGIVTDPTTGSVKITGVEQTATQLTQVKADFDAMQGLVTLQAQRITQLNTDLINAQLDPTGAAVVSGVITQINDVKQTLDAVNATLTQKASSAVVGDHYLQLQQAVQTLSQHGSDLLVIAQTVNALQNDLATADSRLVVLEHSAESTTELVAARLADQAKIEALSADALAGLLTGEAGKQDVVKQLAYAKTSLQANVDTLGQSVAQQLTTMSTIVAGNRADYEAKVALLTTADSTEATARQVLALKQQTDHNTVTAGVANESGARIAADVAEATARQTLAVKQQLDADTLAAGLQTEAATRVNADGALSSQLTTLTASVNSNTAAMQTEALARAAADSTEVTARQTLATKQQNDHNTVSAAVQTEANARTSADGALSSQISTLTAAVNSNSAAVQTESSLRVTGDSAQAQALTNVQASLNNSIAALSQRLAVVVDSSGNVVAAYTLALNVNKRIVGIRVDNNGTLGNFVVQADKFAFVLPGQNTEVPLFVAGVVNGTNTFGINGQLVVDGTIYARSLNVTNLAAISANLGRVSAAQLSIDSDGVGGYGYARSGNKWWYDGQNGWIFAKHPNGETFMEFQGGGNCLLRMNSTGDCRLAFPGITMTNGGLTISQANVIDTLQLQGNAVTVPMSAQAYPYVSLGAGSLALLVSSGWQYMLPPAYVSVIVTVAGIATGGSTDCRVRCMLTASYGGTTPIFDLGCTMVKGDSQTPTFSGSIAVPHGEYWKVDVYVGNDWYDGQWTCKQVSLTAFGAKR